MSGIPRSRFRRRGVMARAPSERRVALDATGSARCRRAECNSALHGALVLWRGQCGGALGGRNSAPLLHGQLGASSCTRRYGLCSLRASCCRRAECNPCALARCARHRRARAAVERSESVAEAYPGRRVRLLGTCVLERQIEPVVEFVGHAGAIDERGATIRRDSAMPSPVRIDTPLHDTERAEEIPSFSQRQAGRGHQRPVVRAGRRPERYCRARAGRRTYVDGLDA
jgi:hypothetical protein